MVRCNVTSPSLATRIERRVTFRASVRSQGELVKLLERDHVFSVVLPRTLLLPVGGTSETDRHTSICPALLQDRGLSEL